MIDTTQNIKYNNRYIIVTRFPGHFNFLLSCVWHHNKPHLKYTKTKENIQQTSIIETYDHTNS